MINEKETEPKGEPIQKPGWVYNFRERIKFYFNEFFYDRWLRVIVLRKDRRIEYRNVLIDTEFVEISSKTYPIKPEMIFRYQGKSYYIAVEGKSSFDPFTEREFMTDRELNARINSKRIQELYLMTQYPYVNIAVLMIAGVLVLVLVLVLAQFGYIDSVESTKLDMLLNYVRG